MELPCKQTIHFQIRMQLKRNAEVPSELEMLRGLRDDMIIDKIGDSCNL